MLLPYIPSSARHAAANAAKAVPVKANLHCIRDLQGNGRNATKGDNIFMVYCESADAEAAVREALRKMQVEIIYEYTYLHAFSVAAETKSTASKTIKRISRMKGVVKVLADRTANRHDKLPSECHSHK